MAGDLKSLIVLAGQASMMLVVFTIGLRARPADLAFAIRRPRLLLRGIFAVNIVVPAVAVALCLLFPVDRATAAGLIIMAVSPLAPLVPGKMFKAGADEEFVVGTYVALVLASLVMVPLAVALVAAMFGRHVTLPISTIASFVGISILTPLIVGVLTIVAYVVLIPIVVLIIGASASKIGALLGDGTLAVIILTVLSALAAGYWLGGPKAQHRLALGQAAATRHPGIAALIIKRNFDDPRVMLAVVLFLLVSVVVTLVYQAVLLKRIRGGEAAGGERPCETS